MLAPRVGCTNSHLGEGTCFCPMVRSVGKMRDGGFPSFINVLPMRVVNSSWWRGESLFSELFGRGGIHGSRSLKQ